MPSGNLGTAAHSVEVAPVGVVNPQVVNVFLYLNFCGTTTKRARYRRDKFSVHQSYILS
jgi:hypothetical protein